MEKKSRTEVTNLQTLVDYQEGTVVSRTLIDKKSGTVTLFAFAEDQGLSEHTRAVRCVGVCLGWGGADHHFWATVSSKGWRGDRHARP